MFEFTVHFQRGWKVGARSLHMEHVHAHSAREAVKLARQNFTGNAAKGFKLTRVDHWDEDLQRNVIDIA
jgi:hypothetical protein